MPMTIEQQIRSIRDDRRAAYVWETKRAADVAGMVPNKFGTWWQDNRRKLLDLMTAFPAETSLEFAAITFEALQRRKDPP